MPQLHKVAIWEDGGEIITTIETNDNVYEAALGWLVDETER